MVFILGKTLELVGMALLAVGLYVGCAKPYGLSEGRAMGVEMGSLIAGASVFFIGRMIEKR